MIAGSEADTRYMTDEAFPIAVGTSDKELLIIDGAQHIETYWVDKYVDAAVDKLTGFFGRTVYTLGADGPWTSPVQYHHDKALHIYFLSQPGTRHGHNIERDARVSAAIYNHPGPPGRNLGLQISGVAERLSDPDPGGWVQYRITPTEVWCFDSRDFGAHRRQVDLSRLDLTDRTPA